MGCQRYSILPIFAIFPGSAEVLYQGLTAGVERIKAAIKDYHMEKKPNIIFNVIMIHQGHGAVESWRYKPRH